MLKIKFAFLILFSLMLALTGNSLAADCPEDTGITVTEFYSDIESGDLTVYSATEMEGLEIELLLEHEDEILDQRTLEIRRVVPGSDIIKVFEWETDSKDDGRYQADVRILKDDCLLYAGNYSFVHGRPVIPRIKVNDIIANSQGSSLMLTPVQPVIVDITYMLVDGSDVIYTNDQERIALSTMPLELREQWDTLLENDKQYKGRVKVRMYKPSDTITVMQGFTAKDDVFISDTYKDAIGASATIEGRSQVPFSGAVRFTVLENDGNGNIVETVTRKSPVLLSGDDETVENIWEQRLNKGVYRLIIEVIGNDGDILAVRETIIEAEAPRNVTNTSTDTDDSSNATPGFPGTHSIIILISAVLIIRLNSKR
ncbi:hypothetical protein [Methanolobus halotolerans]|uniref:Uncharacterized protein n=1 Tax=Methanolobus halotolerans TaxID=2052935 RepID=A0A4E0Q633_9EURY|nr:hypothetical protein [Methanolobus halotolerans]TGC09697.1 hypothetical protein CUN85_04865 [Methanolobus halotolerans]